MPDASYTERACHLRRRHHRGVISARLVAFQAANSETLCYRPGLATKAHSMVRATDAEAVTDPSAGVSLLQ
jgi:hypothetical protein